MSTYVLVRNDLDILNMACRLEDLTQDIFGHALVQSANVESTFVGLRCGATKGGGGGRGHQTAVISGGHGRGDGSRDRVRVLRNMLWRWREVGWVCLAILATFKSRGASVGLLGVRQLSWIGRSASVGHFAGCRIRESRGFGLREGERRDKG